MDGASREVDVLILLEGFLIDRIIADMGWPIFSFKKNRNRIANYHQDDSLTA